MVRRVFIASMVLALIAEAGMMGSAAEARPSRACSHTGSSALPNRCTAIPRKWEQPGTQLMLQYRNAVDGAQQTNGSDSGLRASGRQSVPTQTQSVPTQTQIAADRS